MRIRSIRPEFWSSEDIARLDWHHRLVYIGLWSYVDDNGVGRDVERLIVSALFPLDASLTEASVRTHGALKALDVGGQITRYTVDGRPYLHITAFSTHQVISRPSRGRYPLPTSENAVTHRDLSEPSVSPHANALIGEGEKGRRGEGEKVKYSSAPADAGAAPTSRFDEFWSLYPRKQAKGDARKAWAAAIKREDQDVIIDGLRRLLPWFESQDKAAGDYRPTAGPWLRQERWTDELTPERAPAGRAQQANEAVYATWDRQIEERRQAGLEPPLEITA